MVIVIDRHKTIRIANYFLWISSFLSVTVGVVLALFIGNTTFANIVRAQEEYLVVLAEDFNSKLFREFTLPVAISGVNVSLSNEKQYALLENTVNEMLTGLRVRDVEIIKEDAQIVFSTDKERLERFDGNLTAVEFLYEKKDDFIFVEEKYLSNLKALFLYEFPKNSFLTSVYFPLTVERVYAKEETALLGVLKITIDITSSYQTVVETQRTIFLVFLSAVILLFSIVQYISRKSRMWILESMEENKRLTNQLYQQEKLASMGRMVASIAHEIRNPLGIIQSSSELFASKNENKLDKTSARILDVMIDEIKRLGNIVTDFLDYAKPKNIKYEDVNLSFVIYKALTFLEPKIKSSNIELKTNIEDNLYIRGEEGLIYRAFYNLISNGIQALEDTENPTLEVELKAERKEIIVKIIDNGKGFDSEALEKALDPFYTTKDDGVGLGLPIVHSIIDAHGGELKFSNINTEAVNKGACIEILLKLNAKHK